MSNFNDGDGGCKTDAWRIERKKKSVSIYEDIKRDTLFEPSAYSSEKEIRSLERFVGSFYPAKAFREQNIRLIECAPKLFDYVEMLHDVLMESNLRLNPSLEQEYQNLVQYLSGHKSKFVVPPNEHVFNSYLVESESENE